MVVKTLQFTYQNRSTLNPQKRWRVIRLTTGTSLSLKMVGSGRDGVKIISKCWANKVDPVHFVFSRNISILPPPPQLQSFWWLSYSTASVLVNPRVLSANRVDSGLFVSIVQLYPHSPLQHRRKRCWSPWKLPPPPYPTWTTPASSRL